MAVNWYNKVTENQNDFSPLADAVFFYENELEDARQELKIHGGFQRQAAMLPGLMEYRYGQLQDLEAILEYLNLRRERAHHKAFKMYLEAYSRSLTSRDAERYANADDDVYKFSMLINQVNLLRNKFIGITKGLETKHYQLGYLSRLKAAGFEDYSIDSER